MHELIPQLLITFKLAIVEEEMKQTIQQLGKPEVAGNMERSMEIMKHYKVLTETLKELAKMDIYASSRNMAEVIREQKEAEGEVSLLISAEQNVELAQAYLDYVGEKGSANWLIPIHRATKEYLTEHVSTETLRGNNGNCIHAEYLVMEELGQ